MSFLRWGPPKAWVELVPDPQHRRGNDFCLGLSDARLYARACFALTIFNVKYGPFQKAGFFRQMQEVAMELSTNMAANDPIILHFFPLILKDRGRPASDNSETNRKHFLETLPIQKFVVAKGPKGSLARFNAWWKAFDYLEPDKSAEAFILVCCSLMNGWSKFADEFWSPRGFEGDDSSRVEACDSEAIVVADVASWRVLEALLRSP